MQTTELVDRPHLQMKELMTVDGAVNPSILSTVRVQHGDVRYECPVFRVLLDHGLAVQRQCVHCHRGCVVVDILHAHNYRGVRRK